MSFELSRSYPSRTVGQLRRYFYKNHIYKEGKKVIGVSPNAFVLNPPQLVQPKDIFAQEKWIAVYYHLRHISDKSWFYVIIERNDNHPHIGPHKAILYLQVYAATKYDHPARVIWLGAAQFEGSFYDETRMRIQLKRAIRLKQYFATEESEEEIIELDEYVPPPVPNVQ